MKIEICCDSIASARNAKIGGADRIELCSAINTGGVTPSHGIVKKVKEILNIPINVLIRPRPGNFCYSEEEFEIILSDIEFCKEMKVNGIVSGILLKNGRVDIERTKILLEKSYPIEFTFHRAIDNSFDYIKNIETLINLGVKRILTSGNYSSISKGLENLTQIQSLFGDKITIMPGGGINLKNIYSLIKIGFSEIHLTASKFIEDDCYNNSNLKGMGHFEKNGKLGYKYADATSIHDFRLLTYIRPSSGS
ncbi:MAG: copper homeostasis protein CutC [Bacteroidales bacterium]|jgi:copper homeostasis protein|nr:copper homeostasis protein CutC [Bacteroidales bacterium]